MSRVRLSFQARDRVNALLAARRATESLPGGTRLERAENVRADGRIYIEVVGDRSTLLAAVTTAVGAHATVDAEDIPSESETPDECLNCGNIADTAQARCPACEFEEVSPCPSCDQPIARTAYVSVASGVFRCPNCNATVALRYADPLFVEDGSYAQPVVRVSLLARAA